MKITAVILLYIMLFIGDRGAGSLKLRLAIMLPLLALGIALSIGLEVPTMNELTDKIFPMLKGGLS